VRLVVNRDPDSYREAIVNLSTCQPCQLFNQFCVLKIKKV